jgi:hypothetical protein
VVDIGVLGGAVVAPDDNVLNLRGNFAGLGSDLVNRPVLVKTGHSRKVLARNVGCILRKDQAVCVGWVRNNQNLGGRLANFIEHGALFSEDVPVPLKELSSLHSLLTWEPTDEDNDVCVSESNACVRGSDELNNQWEGSVVDFHDNALKDWKARFDVE